MVVLSLFDGLSAGMLALERIGIEPTCYIASEIDKYAIYVSENNYPDIIRLGDVLNWRSWGLDFENIDLVLAGSPCQGFSRQGGQLGFEDPRSILYFTFLDILNHIKELNPKVSFLLENVRMKPEFLDIISSGLGVKPLAVNSNLLSAQSRLRYYWSNIEIEAPAEIYVDPASICSDEGWKPATTRKGDPRRVVFTGEKFGCLTASYYKGIRADGRPAVSLKEGIFDDLRENGEVRILTPVECERLQTIKDNYTAGVSNTQRYKMLGNSWTVDIISHFLKNLV
jgi:site-specific DNA-cytosine methylase